MRLRLLIGLIAAIPMAQAQTLPPGVVKKASAGGITEYAYPNGLRVLLYPNPANPKVTINVTYLVGSRHEGYGETGMAHLLEHLNFIETTNGRKIKDEIVSKGAQWNGTTSDDRTNYYETVPATDENLKWALGLEADRMVNVKFTKQILDTEMTVVRNEFERGENNPQSVLRARVASTAYLWHNYGKSTIGSKEDLENVPVERPAAFYRKYYQPDNAVVVITGRLDESKTLGLVAETMGKIPRPSRVLDKDYTVEPPQDGERYVELRRVGQNPEVVVAYHAIAAGHPDSAPLQVLAGIMSGGGGGRGGGAGEGRLNKALVENKLAVSASMSAERLHDPGLVFLTANLSNGYGANARITVPAEGDGALLSGTVSLNPVNGPKVEFSFKDELAKTLKDGFTAGEAAGAKKAYLDARMVGRSSDASLLSLLASHELQGRTMTWDEQLEQRIRTLTAEQVNAAFRRHVDAASLSIVKAGDFKAAGVFQ